MKVCIIYRMVSFCPKKKIIIALDRRAFDGTIVMYNATLL